MVSLEVVAILLSGISISASLFYYANVLANSNKTQQQQLETRQAQLFMNIYNQSYTNPQFQNARFVFAQKTWNNFDEFKKMYHLGDEADQEFTSAYDYLGSLYEGIGVLVREGFLDIRLVALLMTGNIQQFWQRTSPIIEQMRIEYNWSRLLIETEYLYNKLMKYYKEHPELAT
jgi:hypothetical protein